jgi:hypothetical protein
MRGCHDATIGVLDMDGFGGGPLVEDWAGKAGVIGCTSRIGCDDGGGTRQMVL